MQLEYFNYLISLVENGSLAKAAAELYISPQGLSKALHRMEGELGINMFYRDKDGLQLSSAGMEVYEAAKKINSINEDLKVTLSRYIGSSFTDDTIIYATPHTLISLVQPALTRYFKKNPKAKLKVTELHTEDILFLHNSSEDSIRILSVTEPMLERNWESINENFVFYELLRAEVKLYVSTRSRLANKKELKVDDVKDYSLALYSSELSAVSDLLDDSFKEKIKLATGNTNVLREIISNDGTLFGLTDEFLEPFMKSYSVVAIPLRPTVKTVYGYILPKNKTPNETIQEMIDIIQSNIRL